jgi:hypothetical protein
MTGWSRLIAGAAALLMIGSVMGDVYLQFPHGANDRNRERNENRNNGNRMCDTQNNARGGVPWCGGREVTGVPDGFQFYTGSKLNFEFTAQHSCGPSAITNAYCNAVMQALCHDTDDALNSKGNSILYSANVRDGYPTAPSNVAGNNGDNNADNNNAGYVKAWFFSKGQNQDGTATIPIPAQPATGINGNAPNFQTAANNNDNNLKFDSPQVVAFFTQNTTLTPADDGGATANCGQQQQCYIPAEFGMHETWDYYFNMGLRLRRNKGLYTADQQLQGNSAIYTRQNPNGARSGLEVPEERDHYPYWNPTPWMDIGVLVSDTAWCDFFVKNSQNTASRQYCEMTEAERLTTVDQRVPINQAECTAKGGEWKTFPAWGISSPECQLAAFQRDNHLGNAVPTTTSGAVTAAYPEDQTFSLNLPSWLAKKTCTFRLRYNMSSSDYPNGVANQGKFFDATRNCPAILTGNNGDVDDITNAGNSAQCYNVLVANNIPLYNRPFVNITGDRDGFFKLGIAFNTNQIGRTFQDRTYVMKFMAPESKYSTGTIYNLNNRGRRGNIVQCYPAVENDFYPTKLTLTKSDFVHIQFCGSDFNPANNPNNGEGWQYSTRYNIVQMRDGDALAGPQSNFPKTSTTQTMFSDADFIKFAFVGQDPTKCTQYDTNNGNNANNSPTNCGKLNMADASFDGGVLQFPEGTYNYLSTRNNNFSNRSNKGMLIVTGDDTSLSTGAMAALIGGLTVGAGLVGFFGMRAYAKRNPNSGTAAMYEKMVGNSSNMWSRIKGTDTTSV